MKILICGGREYANQEKFELVMKPFTICRMVIHGACGWPQMIGVDAMADKWASDHVIEKKRFPADWKKFGNVAGPIRNERMLIEGKPDWVIAFPGGNGTANMVHLTRVAIRAGAEIVLCEVS